MTPVGVARPAPSGKVYVLRVQREGHKEPRLRRVWVYFDSERKVVGKPAEPKRSVFDRWCELHGMPTTVVTFGGIARPSEAAMTIADVQSGAHR